MQVSTTVVSMSDCGVRGPRFESHRLVHELHTFTAVPRSTQPSTLCGTVKSVSAFGLINISMAMVDVDGSSLPWTHSPVVWLGLRVGRHLVQSLHSSN